MKSKLTTKDLIAAGAFAAIYLVLLTVLAVMVLPIVPVLYLATPLIAGIVLGTVYLLYCVKVPKTGAIFILALLVGAITSMASIYPLIAAAVWGVVAEGIAAGKRRRSPNALAASYCVFNLTSMGPFFSLLLAKDAFLSTCVTYYGQEYADTIDRLTPDWIIAVCRFHPDPRSKLALFVAACLCVVSGMTRMQEIVLLFLCIVVLLLSKKTGRAVAVVLLFLLMTLGDQLLVSRLSGVAQYAVLLICHVLRFLLPLAVSFYLVTKTVTVGAYISAFTAMRLPGVVVIPMAVMFRFIPTMTEEWQAVSQALRLRGLGATGINSILHPMRLLEYLLVPFLLQCSEVVDEMSAAVMARGFDKDRPRTNYLELKLGVLDGVLILASLAVTVWNLAF